MSANKVGIDVKAKGAKEATGEIKSLHDAVTRLQKGGAKGFGIGAGAAITSKAFGLAGMAIGKVGEIIGETTTAFIEDEKSQGQLRASLKANIAGWDGNTQAIERVLQSRVKLGFSDEDQRDSLKQLAAATGDVKEALDVQSVAMDLARFKNISLAEASDALTKVEGGSFRILKSLGIQLKAGATQTEALAAVQKVAAGQAEAYTQTLEGKLTVAQVRAKESTEKLGKETAKLSVAWNEMWLHALDPTTVALGDLANAADGGSQSAGAKMRVLQKVASEAGISIDQAWELAGQGVALNAAAMKNAIDSAADAVSGHGDALIGLRLAAEGLPAPLGDVADATDELTDAQKRSVAETKRVNATLDRLAGIADSLPDKLHGLEDAMFGSAQRTGDLAQAQQDLADLMDAEPPTKHTREWKIWAGQVAAAKQSIFDLHFEMAQAKGPEALRDWLIKQRDALSKTNVKARNYLNSLIAINSLKLSPQLKAAFTRAGGLFGNKIVPLAEGGHYSAGQPRLVGENGPELDVPSGSGTIIPNSKLGSSGGSGGSTVININVSTPALTPGGAESLARYLEPIITRAQQRSGVLARVR